MYGNIMSPGVLNKNITVFPDPVSRGENFYTGTYNNNNQHIYFCQYGFAGAGIHCQEQMEIRHQKNVTFDCSY